MNPTPWSIGKKFGVIFFSFYFGMMLMVSSVTYIILPQFLINLHETVWDAMIKWTGANIFRLKNPITIKPNGSGDTTYNYVEQFLWVVFSIILTTAWLIIDRKKNSYNRLQYWGRVIIRYSLGYSLLTYGFIKIIKLQFPFPNLYKLSQPFGETSPMGLAWSFIGYSPGYNLFTGGAEVLAGLLLFWKRTTLLGSLIAMTVMMNVCAMNLAYDIPVKLFSFNLVLMSAYLAAWDWPRLRNLFFANKIALPAPLVMPRPKKWKRILQISLKILFLVYALDATLINSWRNREKYGDLAPRPPLYGIYNVKTFIVNNDTVPPLTTDTARWRQVILNYPNAALVRTMADSAIYMNLRIDTAIKSAVFKKVADTTQVYNFRFEQMEPNILSFIGRSGPDTMHIIATRFDTKNYRLVNRGFHWINEYPFNR